MVTSTVTTATAPHRLEQRDGSGRRRQHRVLRARGQPRPRPRRHHQGLGAAHLEITGHDADGTPFDIKVTDRYASDYDITCESAWEIADFT